MQEARCGTCHGVVRRTKTGSPPGHYVSSNPVRTRPSALPPSGEGTRRRNACASAGWVRSRVRLILSYTFSVLQAIHEGRQNHCAFVTPEVMSLR